MNKQKIVTESPLLPVLVATFIIVATFANNAHALEWNQIWIPLGIAIIPIFPIWFILWIIKDLRFISATATMIVTIVILLYGLVPFEVFYRGLAPILIMQVSIILVALFHKHVKKSLQFITLALVICIASSFGLAQYNMGTETKAMAQEQATRQYNTNLPNIYFIVPDRFTSHEALLECGYDNTEFINQLKESSFYVRDNALSKDPLKIGITTKGISHTTRTLRFLSSVFSDGEEIPLGIEYNKASQKVKYSTSIQEYIKLGYDYHNIGSWYPETKTSGLTTNNYVYDATSISETIYSNIFAVTIIDRSVWKYLYVTPLISHGMHIKAESNRQLYQFDSMKSLANKGSNSQFGFMHLISPHPPFVWAADGKLQTNTELGTIELYVEQTKYIEVLLIDTIEYIQQNDKDAIIIVQADEGMCFAKDPVTQELSNTQFNGILVAWKLPVNNSELETVDSNKILKFTREVINEQYCYK